MTFRKLAALAGGALFAVLASSTVAAQADEPTLEVDPETMAYGDTIDVVLTGFVPDITAQVLLCHEEQLGPTSCDIGSLVEEDVDGEGNAEFEYTIAPSEGYTCDECFLVVIDRIPPTATVVAELEITGEPEAPPATTVVEGGADPLGEPDVVVTPFEDLVQDDVVMVEISGFAADRTVTLVRGEGKPR